MKRLQRMVLGLVAGLLAATGLAMTTQAPAQAASCTSYQYGSGGSGTCVKNIQTMLNGISDLYAGTGGAGSCYNGLPYTKLTTDGQWGTRTDTTVRAFQRWQCLSADGYVGPRTWSRLCGLAGQRDFRAGSNAYLRAAWNAAKASGCSVRY